MSQMQLLAHLPDGTLYADPAQPSTTCRIKNTTAAKSIDGVRVDNKVTEIIINDVNPVTIGERTANDAVSIRIRVSASAASKPRVDALLSSITGQIPAWSEENVFLGFEPTTMPVNPSSSE